MPIGKLRNDLPEARIRTDLPNAHAKTSAILTPGTDTMIMAGTPIGLLLSLTYANSFMFSSMPVFKGIAPTGRIRNTD